MEGENETHLQEVKRVEAAVYDYDKDPRWSEYWSNVLIPPNLASRSYVVDHFKRKFYQKYIVSFAYIWTNFIFLHPRSQYFIGFWIVFYWEKSHHRKKSDRVGFLCFLLLAYRFEKFIIDTRGWLLIFFFLSRLSLFCFTWRFREIIWYYASDDVLFSDFWWDCR